MSLSSYVGTAEHHDSLRIVETGLPQYSQKLIYSFRWPKSPVTFCNLPTFNLEIKISLPLRLVSSNDT